MFCVHLQIESRRQTLSAQALKPVPCPLLDRVPQADVECTGPEACSMSACRSSPEGRH